MEPIALAFAAETTYRTPTTMCRTRRRYAEPSDNT
jgi:hypothetical protein